jgi:hypothetical protein
LLSLDLRGPAASADPRRGYDLIFGLDVFEHLNPNRLDAYIVRLAELVGMIQQITAGRSRVAS